MLSKLRVKMGRNVAEFILVFSAFRQKADKGEISYQSAALM